MKTALTSLLSKKKTKTVGEAVYIFLKECLFRFFTHYNIVRDCRMYTFRVEKRKKKRFIIFLYECLVRGARFGHVPNHGGILINMRHKGFAKNVRPLFAR